MDQWVKNLPINAAGKIVYPNSYIWRLNENLKLECKFLQPLWKSICHPQTELKLDIV